MDEHLKVKDKDDRNVHEYMANLFPRKNGGKRRMKIVLKTLKIRSFKKIPDLTLNFSAGLNMLIGRKRIRKSQACWMRSHGVYSGKTSRIARNST